MFGTIKNKQGETIDYTFHAAEHRSQSVVVIGHGVTGNKDRPFVITLAEALAKAGMPALRISYSGNGASEGRFTDSTISKEVDDLLAVIDALRDISISYVGHSMGGAVGVIAASRDKRIRSLVSLAGMVNTREFAQREFGMVKPGEGNMWDDENCPLSQVYMDDLTAINSVAPLAANIRIPWLVVHGSADDVVPISDSQEIFAKANQPKELFELAGANHVFGGEATQPMVQKVVGWLTQQKG